MLVEEYNQKVEAQRNVYNLESGDFMGFRKREESRPHLDFDEIKDTGKTRIWEVVLIESGEILGKVRWYWAWRRYVFFPNPNTFYDVECMNTITKFISSEMKKRKKFHLMIPLKTSSINILKLY